MKHSLFSLCLITTFTLVPLITACERQGPPKPVGTATNKHVEDSPARPPKEAVEALTEAVRAPLDRAHQAGDTEDRTAPSSIQH